MNQSTFRSIDKFLIVHFQFSGPPASVILYEHKTRSDGCTEEVSIGYLLAQKGLAKCSEHENVTNQESDNYDQESCEAEGKLLEFKESELSFRSAASETRTESKSSSTVDQLEKILASKVGFEPAILSSKSEDQPSENCDLVQTGTNPGSSPMNSENESSTQTATTGDQLRDEIREQKQALSEAVSPDHVTEVRLAVIDSSVTKVNQDSLESSV